MEIKIAPDFSSAARAISNILMARGKSQRRTLRHFMRAWLIDWRVRRFIILRNNFVRKHPCFDFFAADVGKHFTVDLDARTQHLAALLDHFLTLNRVVDDVAVLER